MNTIYRVIPVSSYAPDAQMPCFTNRAAAVQAAEHAEYMTEFQHSYAVESVQVFDTFEKYQDNQEQVMRYA